MTDITPNEVQPKSATPQIAASPDAQERMSIGRYFHAHTLLNRQQWLFFSVAFIGWTWDAFDFFTVSLTTTQLVSYLCFM
ncbi:hypothetical protein PENARI_c054G02511 [Penicillium arizonense]|uniref:MFS transporter n=1 Tax=Penicillium arizonense TaxID=1835702 RepID=A0A1F5L2L1_PENAI|nr:hypothetical protein PENARI_c054G02511 [Penicillium arizonense]OGE47230.1 hypothetical protein PENARI_c054G02511 [Penicillium arizonense]